MKNRLFCIIAVAVALCMRAGAQTADTVAVAAAEIVTVESDGITGVPVSTSIAPVAPLAVEIGDIKPDHGWISPYALPYTRHSTGQNWHRMWINTAVLSGAFVGTLFVLEMLPEDATSWNRAQIQQTPLFQRWYRNIFVRNPEWDHDNPIFNYVLHPYAGAAYFMAARSCGFSFWGSMLYSAAISTIGWEFGIEAFMERPSYQDLFVTPIVGSLLGELCYKGKRAIVNNDYELLGSWFLGHFACFLLDPVNEVIDLFRGSPTRDLVRQRKARVQASLVPKPDGFALTIVF